jgi:segregation and condensation protein B
MEYEQEVDEDEEEVDEEEEEDEMEDTGRLDSQDIVAQANEGQLMQHFGRQQVYTNEEELQQQPDHTDIDNAFMVPQSDQVHEFEDQQHDPDMEGEGEDEDDEDDEEDDVQGVDVEEELEDSDMDESERERRQNVKERVRA